MAYFAPPLAWQTQAWQQLCEQIRTDKLPHGLLAAGIVGIGKRAFVWRLVAFLLCQHRGDQACGVCESCHWLAAGTHPDLLVLPSAARVGSEDEWQSVKVDDIRSIFEFTQNKGSHAKVIVIDQADKLSIAAANALLKTLEEPQAGVFLILISDHPARLLPTIRSRVQLLPLSPVCQTQARDYVAQHRDASQAPMLLALSDGAPLAAVSLPQQPWFEHRATWLRTLLALKSGKRTAQAASSYWQKTLAIGDLLTLSRVMLADVWRVALGLPSLHSDIDSAQILAKVRFGQQDLERLQAQLDEIERALGQNVQPALAFDRLMLALSSVSSI